MGTREQPCQFQLEGAPTGTTLLGITVADAGWLYDGVEFLELVVLPNDKTKKENQRENAYAGGLEVYR